VRARDSGHCAQGWFVTHLRLHVGVDELQSGAVHLAQGGGDAPARHCLGHGVHLRDDSWTQCVQSTYTVGFRV
jgi:hypothetical protein